MEKIICLISKLIKQENKFLSNFKNIRYYK